MTVRARSRNSARLALGDVWPIEVCVTDADGCPAADTVVVTVIDPDEATTVPDVEELTGVGRYRAVYTPATTGRWVATAVGAYGATSFTAWVVDVVTGLQLPDITELDEYLGTNAATDAQLQEALDAEAAAQRNTCRIPAAYEADLRSALLRRCARHLAMMRIPLAMFSGDAEAGPVIVPGRDPEVRRLEGPWRKLSMG